jgi:hypothetical protein
VNFRLQAAPAGWLLLVALLLATLVGAVTCDRRGWPSLVGDEATYLMQAQSLAFDYDLVYTRHDYDRFVALWGRVPEGLILQSTDGGRTVTFGKPAFYPAFLAPFVRLAPRRGPLAANALLLAAAGLAAAWSLRRVAPAAAPWLAAAFLFASVSFAYVFWVHADLFLMACSAVGLALVYGGRREADGGTGAGGRWALLRWLAAGALLAVPALSRPLYVPLLAAAALAVPAGIGDGGGTTRRRALAALAAGAALLIGAAVGVNLAVRGTWTSYGGERLGFYSYTGFPDVELPADAWEAELARRGGNGSWVEPAKLHYPIVPKLWAWDGLYALVGRDVGVLPYFLPVLLGIVGWLPGRSDRRRWPLLAAAALGAFAFIVVRPFNFYGGGGALANRYFLPLYPAFWFLVARPLRPAWVLATAVLAAPFLWPLWTAPCAFPLAAGGELRYVSTTARRLLPYETTLDHLKPTGGEDLAYGALWIKPLANPLRDDDGWLQAAEPGAVELLVGSPHPLTALRLDLPASSPGPVDVEGGRLGSPEALPDGPTTFGLDRLRLTARHQMWWSVDDWDLYQIRLDFPAAAGPPRFRLAPVAGGG